MSDLNVCYAGGWIVSDSEWLPEEDFDYAWPSGGLIVGCNKLQCSSCGQWVEITPAEMGRSYRCKCETWNALSAQQTTDPLDPITERTLPWQCKGHPLIKLPTTLDGVQIDSQTNWKVLAREFFTGARQIFPHPKTENLPAFWISRVHAEVSPSAAGPISRAVSELLIDPEPRVRSCAMGFFSQADASPGVERVMDAARNHLDLFLDVPDPFGGTLFMQMNGLLASQMLKDPQALQLLKDFALRPPGVGMQTYRLQSQDPAWFNANADKILAANPSRWAGILNAMSSEGWERLVELAEMIRARGYATAEEINKAATQHLSVPTAKAIAETLARSN